MPSTAGFSEALTEYAVRLRKNCPKWQARLLHFTKRGSANRPHIKGTICFVDKDASQMMDCCETKQGLSCFRASADRRGSEGCAGPPLDHRSNGNPGKKLPVCFLIWKLKSLQLWASCRAGAALWHTFDVPVAPQQLLACSRSLLKCLEGTNFVCSNFVLSLPKLLQLLSLLEGGWWADDLRCNYLCLAFTVIPWIRSWRPGESAVYVTLQHIYVANWPTVYNLLQFVLLLILHQ